MQRVRLVVFAVALAAASVAGAQQGKQKQNVQNKELKGAKTGGQVRMVQPDYVAQHCNDKAVRILDVRQNPHDYFMGHVPNAVHLADSSLRGPQNGVPVQYWPMDMEASILQRAGIDADHEVVVYSDGDNVLGASMTMYVLERLGHKNVALMNGGFAAYKAGQRAVQAYPTTKLGNLKVREDTAIRATLEDVRKGLQAKNVLFVDARPAPAYRGETSTWSRNGHIPGAVNVDWHMLVDKENTHQVRPVEQVRQVFENVGATPDKDIIVYCGTSREATLEFVALKHMMSYPRVRLYEGSWTEYAATDLPLEKGAPAAAVGGSGAGMELGKGKKEAMEKGSQRRNDSTRP